MAPPAILLMPGPTWGAGCASAASCPATALPVLGQYLPATNANKSCFAVTCCAVQALHTQQASMVRHLLSAGADPLVQCAHTRLKNWTPSTAGSGSSATNGWQALQWRTTVLHMLLGESAGLVLGPVPWVEVLELQQLCLQVVKQEAVSNRQEALLNTRLNEDGEAHGGPGAIKVLYSAAGPCSRVQLKAPNRVSNGCQHRG